MDLGIDWKKLGRKADNLLNVTKYDTKDWQNLAAAGVIGGTYINNVGLGDTNWGKDWFSGKPTTNPTTNNSITGNTPIENQTGKQLEDTLNRAKIADLTKSPSWYSSPVAQGLVTGGLAIYGGKQSAKAQAKAQAIQDAKELTAAERNAQLSLLDKGFQQDIANDQSEFMTGYKGLNPYSTATVHFDKDTGKMIYKNSDGSTSDSLSGLAPNNTSTSEDLATTPTDYYKEGYYGRKAKADADLQIALQNLRNKPSLISANASALNASTNATKTNNDINFTKNAYNGLGAY